MIFNRLMLRCSRCFVSQVQTSMDRQETELRRCLKLVRTDIFLL